MQSNNDISVHTKGRGGITRVQYLDFNELSEIEFPQVFLCHKATVNKKGIKTVKKYGELFPIHNLKITQNLNSVDTVSFSIPRYINKIENQLWHLITDLKIIQIPKFGNFQITVTRTNTGENEIKDIVGQSLEVELGQILLHDFEANTIGQIESDANYQTIYFYRPFDPQHSLLHQILLKTPGWSIGHVDETLWNKVRSFDVNNVSIYDFLTNTIAEELECIFEFDSFHRSISCYLLESYGTHTAIYVSNDNLVNEITVESKSDQIKNCFKVKGGEGIYISEVNPNGTDYLWMLTEQDKSDMSSELKTRLETYDALYQSNITSYENIMKRIHEIFLELSDLTHKVSSSTDPYSSLSECGLMQLKELQSSYQSIEDTYITAGYGNPSNSFYTTLYIPNHTKLTRVASEIKQRENEIETKNTDYKNAQNIRNQIQKTLNLQEYLTLNGDPSLWQELSLYRREDIYENPNYSSTENSTLEEIFELERGLYEDAVKALTEASTPVYHFTANLNNILANPSYASYGTEDFKLGNFIRVELDDESVAKVRLISISIDFDHLENIELEFSDVIGNDGNLVDIKSILNQASSLATSYDTIKRQYESSKNSIDFVSQMKRDGLNAALVSITNSDSQDLLFDEHGLLCRQYNPQKMDFEPEQLKLIHNLIAYTDDNWRSVRQAMGKINFNGVDLYGVIADALVGNIIAGNNLIISNKNNSFIVDEFGATLKNASLSIEKGNTKILLDPENGIKIRSGHTDVFYVDENGHIHIEGIGAGLDLTANGTVKDIYSKITQTAEQIALEVKRATDAEGVLNSKITLTAESLTSTISQSVQDLTTKFNQTSTAITAEAKRALDAETKLSSKLTIASDNITAEIKRAKDAESGLSSRVQQTADSITSEVNRATVAEGSLNSKITQTADSITLEVSRATTAEINLSTLIKQTANSITLKVDKNGIINAINLSTEGIKINASKLDITGIVTFSDLSTPGKTTICGDNITTGSIKSVEIRNSEVYIGDNTIEFAGNGAIKRSSSKKWTTTNRYLNNVLSFTSQSIQIGQYSGTLCNNLDIPMKTINIGYINNPSYSSVSIYTGSGFKLYVNTGVYLSINYSSIGGQSILGHGLWNLGNSNSPFGSIYCKDFHHLNGKLGFFGKTPITQKSVSSISYSPSATSETNANKINEIINVLLSYGLIK